MEEGEGPCYWDDLLRELCNPKPKTKPKPKTIRFYKRKHKPLFPLVNKNLDVEGVYKKKSRSIKRRPGHSLPSSSLKQCESTYKRPVRLPIKKRFKKN